VPRRSSRLCDLPPHRQDIHQFRDRGCGIAAFDLVDEAALDVILKFELAYAVERSAHRGNLLDDLDAAGVLFDQLDDAVEMPACGFESVQDVSLTLGAEITFF
jgi:hypothetical protein